MSKSAEVFPENIGPKIIFKNPLSPKCSILYFCKSITKQGFKSILVLLTILCKVY